MTERTERITTYHTHERTFEIVKLQGMYCAIEDKYIDADGRVNTRLNGLQMKASDTLAKCLEQVKQGCEYERLLAAGEDKDVAIFVAAGTPYETAVEYAKKIKALA